MITVTPTTAPQALEAQVAVPRVTSASVELTALVDPITAFTQLFTNTFNNLAGLGGEVLADPVPLLQAILTNTLGNANILATAGQGALTALTDQLMQAPTVIQTAFTQLAGGNVAGAVDTLFTAGVSLILAPALPLGLGLQQVASNVAGNLNDVVNQGIIGLLGIALAPIYPINATVSAFGALGQDIVNSIGSGDIGSVLQDLVASPAVLANAFLNGFPGGTSSFIDPAGGLLTTAAVGFGSIENILLAGRTIAGLLTRPAKAVATDSATQGGPKVASTAAKTTPSSPGTGLDKVLAKRTPAAGAAAPRQPAGSASGKLGPIAVADALVARAASSDLTPSGSGGTGREDVPPAAMKTTV